MSWTLNGYPILFDHEGTLQKCWDVFMPKNYWATSMPWWVNDDRRSSRSEHRDGRDLPHPNWTPQPDPELNVLFIPNGASRWSQVCLLVDTYEWTTEDLESLYNGEPVTLTIASDDKDGFVQAYHCQRATTISGHPEGQNVQLLTMVDARYWWQWKNYQLAIESSTTWQDIIEELFTELLGVTTTLQAGYVDDSRYGKPDATELTRFGNAALMLDAALWSVGKMFVAMANESSTFLTLTEARNHENLILGRQFPIASAFDSVDLICRRKIDGVIRPDLDPYIHNETITTDNATRPYYKTGHKAVIHTTMTADDTQAAYDGDADSPSNQSTISDLCTAITETYEAIADVGCMDLILAGYWALEANVVDDQGNIIDTNWIDFAEYGMKLNVDLPMFSGLKMGSTLEHQHVGYTRIKTLPPHFGSSFNLCQDGYFVDDHPAEVILFSLNAELTTSTEYVAATVEAYFNGKDPGSTVNVYNTETATASVYGMATASGKFGYAYLDKKSNKYYIIHLLC